MGVSSKELLEYFIKKIEHVKITYADSDDLSGLKTALHELGHEVNTKINAKMAKLEHDASYLLNPAYWKKMKKKFDKLDAENVDNKP